MTESIFGDVYLRPLNMKPHHLSRDQVAALIPHLHRLDAATEFKVYITEVGGAKDKRAELTIWYREPGAAKFRIDAEFDELFLIEGITPAPQHIRINNWVQWGGAYDEEYDRRTF